MLIRRAIADLQRSAPASPANRAINYAYAIGMIDLAHAEETITVADYDEFRRQAQLAQLPKEAANA